LHTGLREFWLTSQDTACYGRDIGTNLTELLDAVCRVKDDFKVRVGMMTPNHVVDILDDLIRAFRSKHVFKFLHLPVQSGDDAVLKRMRRFYSVDDFKKIVNTFRVSFPNLSLATDLICGFPREDEEAFVRSLKLVEAIKPDVVNVSKFFARPRTAAAAMEGEFVPLLEIKRRSALAAALARKVSFERNQNWVKWTGQVLFDEVGKVSGSWVGRNFAYKPIVVKSADHLLGKIFKVKVLKPFPTYLQGEIVE
jgi:threonylcarbamoyladenosine tRNA methylthiotransferase CDKAL1